MQSILGDPPLAGFSFCHQRQQRNFMPSTQERNNIHHVIVSLSTGALCGHDVTRASTIVFLSSIGWLRMVVVETNRRQFGAGPASLRHVIDQLCAFFMLNVFGFRTIEQVQLPYSESR